MTFGCHYYSLDLNLYRDYAQCLAPHERCFNPGESRGTYTNFAVSSFLCLIPSSHPLKMFPLWQISSQRKWVLKLIKMSKRSKSCFTRVEPILISRFLLNLRQVGEVDPVNNTQDALTSQFSVPGFRIPTLESILMVGNMGEYLDHGPAEMEDSEITDVDEGIDPLDSSTQVPSGESI